MKKILYFQDETNYFRNSEVSNISTVFMNDFGEKIYVELHRGEEKYLRTMSKKGNKPLKTPVNETIDDAIICYFCCKILKEGEEGEKEIPLLCQKKVLWSSFFVTLLANIFMDCCLKIYLWYIPVSRVFRTASGGKPLTQGCTTGHG